MGWSQPAPECLTYASSAVVDSSPADPALSKRRPSTESRESRETFSFLLSSIENFDGPQIDIGGCRRALCNKRHRHLQGQGTSFAARPSRAQNNDRAGGARVAVPD